MAAARRVWRHNVLLCVIRVPPERLEEIEMGSIRIMKSAGLWRRLRACLRGSGAMVATTTGDQVKTGCFGPVDERMHGPLEALGAGPRQCAARRPSEHANDDRAGRQPGDPPV